jgi:hypothetical protein
MIGQKTRTEPAENMTRTLQGIMFHDNFPFATQLLHIARIKMS